MDHGAASIRQRLFAGNILWRPATPGSLALASLMSEAVGRVVGEAWRTFEGDVHTALGALRASVALDAAWWGAIATIIAETGFDPLRQRVDPPRARALGPALPASRAPRGAYAVHRDTWYANPPCQVNWWLAVHDITEHDSFAFYPAYFERAIDNDSGLIDYTEMAAAARTGRLYASVPAPDTCERPPAETARHFRLARGEMLLFSGGHLHGGVPVTSGLVRYSVDFRTVDEDDLTAGRGAPMLDVECRGHAEEDYVVLRNLLTAPPTIATTSVLSQLKPAVLIAP